jgi:hypothetical protein
MILSVNKQYPPDLYNGEGLNFSTRLKLSFETLHIIFIKTRTSGHSLRICREVNIPFLVSHHTHLFVYICSLIKISSDVCYSVCRTDAHNSERHAINHMHTGFLGIPLLSGTYEDGY